MALSEEAQKQIDKARRRKSTELYLDACELETFPLEILEIESLQSLYLSYNNLRVIPEAIRTLRHLAHIWIDGNPIQRTPDIPGLCLDGDTFLRLQRSLSAENIRGLVLRSNYATLIPQFGNFTGLMYLYVHDLWTELPMEIRHCAQLQVLALSSAPLRDLPDWIGDLPELRDLGVRGIRLTEFPEVLLKSSSLRVLDLSSKTGQIQVIPPDILHMESLRRLDLTGHPIHTPPPEVVSQGVKAIKDYWRQRVAEGVDHLCEAKLLILGEPGAGKTSLANKIQDASYVLKPAEESTEGIEVAHWSFPSTVKAKPRDFRVNIWDFGGQEIYHATHQFFLTRRSLYLIVADDRKEDTDFNYWLDVIELLSDGSPVLVIQNEKQNRRREIDFGPLRARFDNLRQSYRVNLADNRGLEDAVRAIRREMEQLPHIGAELPKTWKRVRDALEQHPRDYISQEQYFEICQQSGFTRTEDKLQLSAYLHDLGICLHFQDDPVLQHTVVLKPKWGTDAVYRAIDDKGLFASHGRFRPADLDRIWSGNRYTGKRHELLRLMMKFQLCYQVPDTNTYIAPQLLPVNQPSYEWPGGPNLIVRYEYDFMPKGLLTRLIVALHHRIGDQDLVWRSGAIFQRDATRAEVIEDYARRRIHVRVNGPDARGLFTIIDDQLERIHATFRKLKFEKWVRCNCSACGANPHLFPLSQLKKFAAAGKGIQCGESMDLVDAGALLRNLFPADVRFRPEPRVVFVSYRQNVDSIVLVDQIESVLRDHKINLLRDRNAVGYRESFRRFMERMGEGDAIVVLLSDEYLHSQSCMFELTEIAARGDFRRRVYPVALRDTAIDQPEDRARIVEYWNGRLADLKRRSADQEIGDVARICAQAPTMLKTLADMNMLKAGDTFKPIVDQLERLIAP